MRNCDGLLWFFAVCTDGTVRLSGGLTESEGTDEICFDNLWGLVAQSKWSTSDAQVTCRQLGYPSQGAQMSISLHHVNIVWFIYNVHLKEHRQY